MKDHLGIGNDETTDDGKVTLEHVECNAACDYAPVVMVNWEFFDNQTPESVRALVDALRADEPVAPTRGSARVATWRETSRVLAGFYDGRGEEGVGRRPHRWLAQLAHERDWTAPAPERLARRSRMPWPKASRRRSSRGRRLGRRKLCQRRAAADVGVRSGKSR